MSKISIDSASAFMNDTTFKNSNTTVKVLSNGVTELRLHGNLIARKENGRVQISSGGWQTKTTKERLNALPNVHINQVKGEWYLNGVKWFGSLINIQ